MICLSTWAAQIAQRFGAIDETEHENLIAKLSLDYERRLKMFSD